ncbi:hypothetical protein MKX03_000669 [Papaver bracteatum]|nr:hypothetical protein MKX03_000669 [Papaver bracteatum]
MYFCIGGKVIKYGKQESALMTGLSFKGSDVIPPHGCINCCAGSDLISKYFPGKRRIKLEELSRKFDSVEQSMDKVKLGLVLLVQRVLIGADYPKDVNLAYLSMVENIEKFNKFPWGKLSHRRMLKCFRAAVIGKNEVERIGSSKNYKLFGFPYAFQAHEGEMVSKYMESVLLMSAYLSESEDGDEDIAEEMQISTEIQFANEVWEAAKDKDDGAQTQAPQSCSNQDSQLLREVLTQVKQLTSKVSRMDEEISKLKDNDNRNYQASIEMEVIDKDERLKGLANDSGDEVYKAFITVLSEMNASSLSRRYTVPEWRKFKNGGMEILKKVASSTLEQWRTLKKTFENDKEIKSLETKMKEMESENKNLMYQNDELRKHYNEEISKMQLDHKNHLERINREHEDLKSEVESERKGRLEENLLKGRVELEKDMARDKLELELEASNYKIKEMRAKSNDELQEARNELTRELSDMSSRAFIGVKRMGELELKPFYDICTSWEACLRDPHWHPFKIIEVGNNHQEIINEDDEKLRSLRNEFGEEVYKAVTTAIMEMNEYNASGRFVVSELWNFREGRKAPLNEVVSYLLKQVKTLKRNDKLSISDVILVET